MQTKREIWIDNSKSVACILVVLGHFFQSMTKANLLPQSALLGWFDEAIYYFHVPIFFFCSGYLYQRTARVDSPAAWRRNLAKKALALGVPYLTFSCLTWLLKTLFADAVNDAAGGLLDTLLVHPASPYWYLYALFFLFCLVPTFQTCRMAAFYTAAAVALKAAGLWLSFPLPALTYLTDHAVWFVLGMLLARRCRPGFAPPARYGLLSGVAAAVFLALSVVRYQTGMGGPLWAPLLCLLGIAMVLLPMAGYYHTHTQNRFWGLLARYTLPIYLMHTLCAAPLRVLLNRLGIHQAPVHLLAGLFFSFAGPIFAAWVAEKLRWPLFFLYPNRVLAQRRATAAKR